MNNKRKLIALVLAFSMILACVALTGCGDDKKKDEKKGGDLGTTKAGVLTVGLDDTFAPMGYREKGKLVGFDIDLAKAVGKKMGYKVKFRPISWDAKDLELKSRKIDCIWNGMSITPEREKKMSLSKKYLNNKILLMTNKKNVKIEKETDLNKYKIGTQADSSALQVLQKKEEYSNFKENITEYKDYDKAILDLKAGRTDVIAIDQVLGEFKNKNMKGILSVCKYDLGNDFYVIGFRKGDTKLRDEVNKAIKALIDNGEAEEISKKWFGKNIVIFK